MAMRLALPRVQKLTKLTAAGIVLALAGCREGEAPGEPSAASAAAPVPAGFYRAGARDALCVKADGRAGFITYAGADERTNCSVRGRLQGGAILPDGDQSCRIPVTLQGGNLLLGDGGGACAYYCGPNASFASRAFTRQGDSGEAVDLAGDPLC